MDQLCGTSLKKGLVSSGGSGVEVLLSDVTMLAPSRVDGYSIQIQSPKINHIPVVEGVHCKLHSAIHHFVLEQGEQAFLFNGKPVYHRYRRSPRADQRHPVQDISSNMRIADNDDSLPCRRYAVESAQLLLPFAKFTKEEVGGQLEDMSQNRKSGRAWG